MMDNPRVQSAFKATITGLIAIYIYLYFQLSLGYLAVLGALFIMLPTLGLVTVGAINMLLGMSAGAFVGISIASQYIQYPSISISLLALWCFTCLYSVKYFTVGIGCILAAAIAVAMVALSTLNPTITVVFTVALVSSISIGVILYLIISHL